MGRKPAGGPWFVYILECENGSFYTGSTDNIERRFEEHRLGTARSKYTRSFRPRRVVAAWRVSGGRGAALKVEGLIKGMSRRGKDALVASPEGLEEASRRVIGADCYIIPHPVDGDGRVPVEMRDIIRYTPRIDEGRIRNPYLEELLALMEAPGARNRGNLTVRLHEKRSEFVSRYAFAIPTLSIVEEIARHSPLVEIGAGSGYWAMCLHDAGADILAYDLRPPGDEPPWEWREANPWFGDTWFHVLEGGCEMAGVHPDRTLFLCWPPPEDPMAGEALGRYREAGGNTMIFIGSPGSSADASFFRQLESLRPLRSERLWSWPDIEEWMVIASVE